LTMSHGLVVPSFFLYSCHGVILTHLPADWILRHYMSIRL
jgi:hypothetical protein